MAIFYKHIKGTTNATSNDDGLWTWIKWSSEALSTDVKCIPELWVTEGNNNTYPAGDSTKEINLGHIITSNATEQSINKIFTFKDGLHCEDAVTIAPRSWQEDIPIGGLYLWDGEGSENDVLVARTDLEPAFLQLGLFHPLKIQDSISGTDLLSIDVDNLIGQGWSSNKAGNFNIQGHIIVGDASNATDGQYIQAPYFNATSDIRAKENLSPLSTNALDIIKKVQVYTFNYKNNPEERTIGVIAQEFLDKKLDNVSLVANEGASGENDDYMSIKETKLIYLLLKGMQEQQAEIDDLKQQIKKLESK